MFTTVRFVPLVLLAVCTLSRAEDSPKTISVSGEGKISAPPNVVDINVGVVTQAAVARAALSDNNEKMIVLYKALKDRGVAAKDIQTVSLSVKPRYTEHRSLSTDESSREHIPKLLGYDVINMVSITGRDLTKFGDLLDAVTTAGANQVNGINFRIDEADALLDSARKKAMADAKKKADLLAGEAGVVVGPPITISDQVNRRSPPQEQVMFSLGASGARSSVPIAGGEQELSVTVHVVYELRLPK